MFFSVHAKSKIPFSEEELLWIKSNPVVLYSIQNYWPIEYTQNGQHKGLSYYFLDKIAEQTGLEFKLIPAHTDQVLRNVQLGKIHMSTIANPTLHESIREKMLFSHPYLFSDTVIVRRSDQNLVFGYQKLSGMKVAVKGGGGLEYYLRKYHPDINLVIKDDTREALKALYDGSVSAVVDGEALLRAIIEKNYYNTLSLSGTLIDMYVSLQMPIAPQYPILQSIINKSLENISSKERDNIYKLWLQDTQIGQPSWRVIVNYYLHEIIALIVFSIIIVFLYLKARIAEQRAVASENQKSQFLAVMSHEIRTPMNAVLAPVDLLLRTPLSPRQKALTELAKSSATNLIELLNDVLDISKLESHNLTLSLAPCNLEELAKSVSDSQRLAANKKGVRLQLFTSQLESVDVYIDPMRLRQILTNLLSNSVKFTDQGNIVLSLSLVEISTDRTTATLTISVKDSGIGITPDKQSKVFEAYQQANNTIANKYGGTGLGLSICKQLVLLMGGTISLQSQPNSGTTIYIKIPVKIACRIQDNSTFVQSDIYPTAIPSSELTANILVVEDLATNRQVLHEQLCELGQRSTFVEHGEEALRKLESGEQFDLILMDCNLPDIDGYQVTERIRKFEQKNGLPLTPIIAISAATSEQHKLRCIEFGMDGILTKPITLNDLENILSLWLPEPESSPPASPTTPQYRGTLEELYWKTCQEDMKKLRTAIEQSEWVDIRHYVHRLKGGALTIGQNTLAQPVKEMEDHLLANEQWSVTELLSWLDDYERQLTRWYLNASNEN